MTRGGSCRSRHAGAGALALVLALSGGACSSAGPSPAPASAAPSPSASSPAAAHTPFRSVRTVAQPAVPVRLRIPRLEVDAPVRAVGLADDGTVEVPRRWGDVGWYSRGSRPGEPGPSVLLGHVDSREGPAVFFRVRELRGGDVVEVTAADGARTRFRVERVTRSPKTQFPTDEVYLPTLSTELRLVTCGGAFDRRSGHYLDNVVAYASVLA